MKKSIIIFIVLISISSLSACDLFLHSDWRGGEWFYLYSAGAYMPVWVCGNKSSNVFVIFLHGGPGGSAVSESVNIPIFKQFEEKYAFVYWDQRGSGNSQGNTRPESFTVDQFVKDLQRLVHLIRFKYNNPVIFLFGYSWGGGLGTAFLIEPQNQQHISGWINMCGLIDAEKAINLSWEWAKNNALKKINAGIDVRFWERELEWYNSADIDSFLRWSERDINRFYRNLDRLNGGIFDPSKLPEVSFWAQRRSPMSFAMSFNSINIYRNFVYEEINFTSEMYKITIPSLVLWGRHDGFVPVQLAQITYDGLGSSNKYLYIFEYSAHDIFLDEPKLFFERVVAFIENYR